MKATVEKQFVTESLQWTVDRVQEIHAARVVDVNGAEMVTTREYRQWQIYLNYIWPAAMVWPNAAWQMSKEPFDYKIDWRIPVPCKNCYEWFKPYNWHLLLLYRSTATAPRRIFTIEFTQMNTVGAEDVSCVATWHLTIVCYFWHVYLRLI